MIALSLIRRLLTTLTTGLRYLPALVSAETPSQPGLAAVHH
jgi:hypothetical protein